MYGVGGLPTDTFVSGDTAPTADGRATAVPRNSTATTDNRRSVMASPSRSDCGHHTPAHRPAQDVDAPVALTDLDGGRRDIVDRLHQLQPLVDPQLGQAWHEPARIICTPHCMHMGASL